ncbi:uncharacterized protein [Palaemon carinicauda]|uniref:uncharacterized protein n=1 Tax=Palaemon carinicauda TaxID=392227 RepID=UPI0035B62C09
MLPSMTPTPPTSVTSILTTLVNFLGITLHKTTAYNTVANRMVERFHQTLKAALISCCSNPNWFTWLSWVIIGLRITPKHALNVLATGMVYGDLLVIPAEFFPFADSSNNLQHLCHIVGKFTPCRQTDKLPAKQHNKRFTGHYAQLPAK